jgi:hypothetical protein
MMFWQKFNESALMLAYDLEEFILETEPSSGIFFLGEIKKRGAVMSF